MCQISQCVSPEKPQGPQQRGEHPEKQHRTAQRPQHHKSPQLSLRPPQEKEGHGKPGQHAVKAVQHAGQAGTPQAEGPQQIIQQSRAHAQQNGLPKHQHLVGNLVPHGYPNRRLNSPPRPPPSSS